MSDSAPTAGERQAQPIAVARAGRTSARRAVQATRSKPDDNQNAFWSAVDDGHVSLLMAPARSRGEVVEPLDLLRAQFDAVGFDVFFDAGDALGAGDRGDDVDLRE
jgi:hypothetical protein